MNNENKASRKFCHKEGFGDETQYLECFPNGETHAILAGGKIKKGFERHYPINVCEEKVERGVWIEF